MFDVQLIGDWDLMRKLDRLSSTVTNEVVRPAVGSALVPINKAAKAKCPVAPKAHKRAGGRIQKPGALKKSIGRRVRTYSQAVWGGVGPRKTAPEYPGRRVHLVEYGIPSRGIAAQPFLRPALDENKEKAMGILRAKIWLGLDKQARKP